MLHRSILLFDGVCWLGLVCHIARPSTEPIGVRRWMCARVFYRFERLYAVVSLWTRFQSNLNNFFFFCSKQKRNNTKWRKWDAKLNTKYMYNESRSSCNTRSAIWRNGILWENVQISIKAFRAKIEIATFTVIFAFFFQRKVELL